jgi:hypothetical protein
MVDDGMVDQANQRLAERARAVETGHHGDGAMT